MVREITEWSELPSVCGPVVSTVGSKSRRLSSFTDREEHQSTNYFVNMNYCKGSMIGKVQGLIAKLMYAAAINQCLGNPVVCLKL